jgi:lipid II:glycine glycyltransferase (peptidoglycan interpeptide bridge formation enzyme)
MTWQGTFYIWQNRDFGKIYAQFNNNKILFLNKTQGFVSRRPIIGNLILYLYCPLKENGWLDKLNKLAKKLNVAKVWIYSIEPVSNLEKFFKENLFTFLIDLKLDKEQLWQNLGKKTRNMVRKGKKSTVKISIAESEKEFEQWWQIYIKAAQLKKFGKQNFSLVKEIFKNKNFSRLFVSSVNNKIVCGSLFLVDKYPMYWLGAFNPDYNKYAPANINIWQAMLWFKEKEYQLLDLGGAILDKEHGPTRFKKSFGGKMEKAYIYEIPISKFKNILLNLVSWFKRIKI